MRIFYGITKAIKDSLESNEVTNVVTLGDISDLDLSKQTIFPLAHIVPEAANIEGTVVTLDLSVTLADIVDFSTEDTKAQNEPFYGNNNLHDVLDTQLFVGNLLVNELQRGNLWDQNYQVTGATLEPFMDRYENVLSGWVLSLQVQTSNQNISIC